MTAPKYVLEQRHCGTIGILVAHARNTADCKNTLRTTKALEMDTSEISPPAICNIILAELHRRAGLEG